MKPGDLIQFGRFKSDPRTQVREGIVLKLEEAASGGWLHTVHVLSRGRHMELRTHQAHPDCYILVDESSGGSSRDAVNLKIISSSL